MTKKTFHKEIEIPIGKIKLGGELIIPEGSQSLVIFSHGSGSSRYSTRNNFVAEGLRKKGISTFLFDLLTKEEDELHANRFNIALLTERLILATDHITMLPQCKDFHVGYFGASTGAASALRAAAILPGLVEALVSRGGRPDLVLNIANKIKAPTLLIVGEEDYEVLKRNKEFYNALQCEKKLEVIAEAGHLFEEPGALLEVTALAADWFDLKLQRKEEFITR